MAPVLVRRTEHQIAVDATADHVYALLADVSGWPAIFTPNIHAERVDGDDRTERIHLWAFANGVVKDWISRRELDPAARRIVFRQEVSRPPVGAMSGSWVITPRPGGGSVVLLRHEFSAAENTWEQLDWIDRAVHRNSKAELDGLKEAVDGHGELSETMFSFEDTVVTDGALVSAYDMIRQGQDWPLLLPHVARVDLVEETPGVQLMEMDTRAPDGSLHTTHSVRVCLPPDRIVYKQTVTPPIMAAHTGEWSFQERPDGLAVTSRHTVVLRPERIAGLLGPDATIADARAAVRKALSTNSSTTLAHLRERVEGGVRA